MLLFPNRKKDYGRYSKGCGCLAMYLIKAFVDERFRAIIPVSNCLTKLL